MRGISPFWFYMGLVSILVIAFVYYQGLTADVNAVGPYAIQALSLAQGRNPATFNFSNYPGKGGSGPGPGGHSVGTVGGHPAANLSTTSVSHPPSGHGIGRKFTGNRSGPGVWF